MVRISAIFIATNAGEPMIQKSSARIFPKLGLDGDRYALGLGAYSKAVPTKTRDVSLIAREGIDAANRKLKLLGLEEFLDNETRRNIVIEGLSSQELNKLVNQEFYLGGLRFKATELCIPCERPSKLAKKNDFLKAFEGRGGIRAQILEAGEIKLGDRLSKTLAI
ncbi:MOSC domain-containing protein [Polynucleobacter asymbioticus]|uniref:MOSC domain containing protein n=1 Tax=Polynucleobacter asymbioticus (strain DSM 18221 / CIP 109841 / QLW-P1DMWA-1) TaxID=312153 RepID=A4SUZ0_POLAQ|nr:MOSC domain-containing protein [Polynucleobacter asymbioticus]ABP33304.1 MOSC domain containing protein [Polynucleobacter asymbioticus QLW-P1DMWA-1]APC05110.1 sulfurase [Polynucleobacter asymbioticus]